MMELDLADKLDLEWHSIFQKHLKYFSYKNKSESYSIEDILKEVFCPDPNSKEEVKYEDKEVFEKCIIEALNLLLNRQTPPRQTQIRHLLSIAKYISKDELCFINLNSKNVILSLMYLSQPSTELSTKIAFMDFLHSFVEHESGAKWLMETQCWTQVLALTVNYQEIDAKVSNIGYDIIRLLLEKTFVMNQNYFKEIVRLMAEPLLNTAQQIKLLAPDSFSILKQMKPHITCFVKVMESLLKNYSANVLHYLVDLEVGIASDTISEKCNDEAVCLILDRITIILSFFGLTEVFDGIKSIQKDPLIVTGFVRIIDKKVDKGFFTVIFELYYYALKYLKPILDKWPQYYYKGQPKDAETQLVGLQLEPILLEWARLDSATHLVEDKNADLEHNMSHPLKLFKRFCLKTLHVGFKIRDKLPECSFEVYTKSIKNITRSKDLYSKKSICDILDCFVYALEAPLKYLQSKKDEQVTIEERQQVYIWELLKATLNFIESFDLNWYDSLKILDLLYIIIEGCSSYPWIEPIMLDSLRLLQEVISRRFSPSMALLIDNADGFQNIGPLLYKTLFTINWKVRKEVLEVVHTITLSANNGFSSFKTILFNASLPSLISTMALSDDSNSVRATAIKCLQQMFIIEDVEEILPKNFIIIAETSKRWRYCHQLPNKLVTVALKDRVLDFIVKNIDAEVTTEAIKLVETVYKSNKYLDKDITTKMYKCLEREALSNDNNGNVRKEVVDFWRTVTRKYLTDKGWSRNLMKFPEVTFSKRIISLTFEEVNKRCFIVLTELSRIGCLNVFEKLWQSNDNPTVTKKSLIETLYRFNHIFTTHKITPESMLFYQEMTDLSSMQIDLLVTPQESEDILQEIISEAMIEMSPSDLQLENGQEPYSLIGTSLLNTNVPSATADLTSDSEVTTRITPSKFVDLVYKKVLEHSSNGGSSANEDSSIDTDVYIIDY